MASGEIDQFGKQNKDEKLVRCSETKIILLFTKTMSIFAAKSSLGSGNLQSQQRNSKGVQRTLLNRLQTHQKRVKKNPEDACNLSKTPPRRCHEQPGKRTPGKSEFSGYGPRQSRQRVPKRPPENPPKAPPDAPKRFESITEK